MQQPQKAIIQFTIPRQLHSSLTLGTANPALAVYHPPLALGHLSPQVGPLFLPNPSLHLPQRPYDNNSQVYRNRLQLTLRMLSRKQATLLLLLVVTFAECCDKDTSSLMFGTSSIMNASPSPFAFIM